MVGGGGSFALWQWVCTFASRSIMRAVLPPFMGDIEAIVCGAAAQCYGSYEWEEYSGHSHIALYLLLLLLPSLSNLYCMIQVQSQTWCAYAKQPASASSCYLSITICTSICHFFFELYPYLYIHINVFVFLYICVFIRQSVCGSASFCYLFITIRRLASSSIMVFFSDQTMTLKFLTIQGENCHQFSILIKGPLGSFVKKFGTKIVIVTLEAPEKRFSLFSDAR